MKKSEEFAIEQEVKFVIVPEIKALIPGLLGMILRWVFPKMEDKLIEKIKALFDKLLAERSK